MPSGMGVTNPKFAKSVRKPKKTKHCTIPEWWQRKKIPPVLITNEKWEHTVLNRRKSRWYPKHEVRGSLVKKLQGEKEQHVSKKGKRVLVIFT